MRSPPARQVKGSEVATRNFHTLDTSPNDSVDKSSSSVITVSRTNADIASRSAWLTDVPERERGGVAVASILGATAAVIITPCAVDARQRHSGRHRPRGGEMGGVVGGGGADVGGGVGDVGRGRGRVVNASTILISATATTLLPRSLIRSRARDAPSRILPMVLLPMAPVPVSPEPARIRLLTATVAPFGTGGGLSVFLTTRSTRLDMRITTNVNSAMVVTSARLVSRNNDREVMTAV